MKLSNLPVYCWICVLTLTSFAKADEPQWKLQPLQYNNPGLNVDLGVGLWAFPLPMDYDNDGDLDLLVGCPDKPSNGTYFFENPSQDPNEKMPVFKPGVRIAHGSHFMQMSVVDGEPVVMLPAKEFRRDAKTGKPGPMLAVLPSLELAKRTSARLCLLN